MLGKKDASRDAMNKGKMKERMQVMEDLRNGGFKEERMQGRNDAKKKGN